MRAAAPATSAAQQRLWASVQAGNVDEGRAVVRQELSSGVAGSSIVLTMLVPTQREVGLRWQRAQWSVADEHAATAVVDACLAVVEQDPRRDTGDASVVVACAESEWHSLPARLGAQLLREAGVHVRFLGPSLPADHLREYLARLDPDALVLSTTMPTSLPGAARCIDAAHDIGVPVVVGGGAFGPDAARAQILGADAWFSDMSALAVPDLRRPRPQGAPLPAWPEWHALQAAREAACDTALVRLLEALPAFAAAATPAQLTRTREDLAYIVDFASVAVLVDDPRILWTFMDWLAEVLTTRGVPPTALDASYAVLADELGGEASSLLTAHAAGAP